MLPKLPDILPEKLQDLPPAAARFCLQIKKNLESLLRTAPAEEEHPLSMLLAVSGGADSVSMLTALICLSTSCNISLEVCHIDHGLRPEAKDEAAWVATLCKKMRVPCHIRSENIRNYADAHNMGLEEAGRAFRYKTFEAIRKERNLHCIATAHTANDLAEDILMRMIRGTGWPGLGGMPGYDAKRRVVRPLLFTSRAAIEHFLHTIGLPFLEDPSNQDLSFFRNRVRHVLMPILLRENPKFIEHMIELGQEAELDRRFWDTLLPDPGPFLERSILRNMPESGRLRLYKRHIEHLGCRPTTAALKSLDRAYLSGKGGLCIKFSGKGQAHITAKGILFILPEHILNKVQ